MLTWCPLPEKYESNFRAAVNKTPPMSGDVAACHCINTSLSLPPVTKRFMSNLGRLETSK